MHDRKKIISHNTREKEKEGKKWHKRERKREKKIITERRYKKKGQHYYHRSCHSRWNTRETWPYDLPFPFPPSPFSLSPSPFPLPSHHTTQLLTPLPNHPFPSLTPLHSVSFLILFPELHLFFILVSHHLQGHLPATCTCFPNWLELLITGV